MTNKGNMMKQKHTSLRMNAWSAVSVLLCLVLGLCLSPEPVAAEGASPSFLHTPIVEQDIHTSTGLKTTWSCVFFGAYPSAEVVYSDWDAVDDYALRPGDVIRDDALWARLESGVWQDDHLEIEGNAYIRVGLDRAPATCGVREQHYNWDYSRPWHYFQIQPIRWRVLDIQENKALLLADRMPDSLPYNTADADVTWDASTLRSWLNGYGADANEQGIDYSGAGFIDRAFTAGEREAILPAHCENLPNRDYGTNSGADTEDRLFILSNADVFEGVNAGRYGFEPSRDHDDPAKRFTSTLYAKCMGAWWSPVEAYAGNSFWFMRTNGYTPRSVTYVCDFGYIYSKGTLVACADAGVLPAMWIDLDNAAVSDAGEVVSTEIMHTTDDEEKPFPIPDITNPIVLPDETAPDGTRTIWNAVAFGHYPQTEILSEMPEGLPSWARDGIEVNQELYRKLEENADNEEITLDDTRYLRLERRWFRCDPIIWRVLEVSDGTALLLSDRCLDTVPYHTEYKDVFWEDSTLRSWLNHSFLEIAFTGQERRGIAISAVSNSNNHYFGTACGSGTRDRVFILSEEEVFSSGKATMYGFQPSDAIADTGRRLKPTAYAAARGAWQSTSPETEGFGFWLLRTNGYTRDNVVYVGEKGYLYNRGIPVTCGDAGIVPAIRVRLGDVPLTRVGDISWHG